MGELYFFGAVGLSIDFARAAKWYRKTAESGDAYAQYLLAHLYDQGLSGDKDPIEAIKWFLLAANQGEVKAQSRLAWMYFEGVGAEKDLIAAYVWSNLAATASIGKERAELDELRNYISIQLSPDDLKFAQEHTRSWRAQR